MIPCSPVHQHPSQPHQPQPHQRCRYKPHPASNNLALNTYLQALRYDGVLQLGSGGGLQGLTSDTRYLDFMVDYMAANVLGLQTFLHPKGAGPFEDCGGGCAVATGVMGIASFSSAGAACALTVGFGCPASILLAGGLTSVVYEATSNPNAKGGQLACAFVFGPSSNAAAAVISVASAGTSAAVAGSGKVAMAAVKSVGQSAGFTASGKVLCG